MTIPVQLRSPRYNKLKRRALEIFERHGGWLSPPDWAGLASFYPVRAAYSYLKRLHQFGLLERGPGSSPVVVYRLSEKGRERLVWLLRGIGTL
jgi:hypothetical protein